ncbi:MAG: hypothetical protein PHW69_07915 [Elusimicrobiaceae bacterium]|nr:hypothetical protein [Elusimicrobiaceae bacterium]
MIIFLKILAGFVLCLVGLGYLVRPEVIWRINEVIRNTILNDSYMALERKKWGLFLILVGTFLLYSGYSALGR